MNITQSKFFTIGLFFIFILLSGFWVSRARRPYRMVLITVHKLIGLAAGVYLGWSIYQLHKVNPLTPVQIAAVAVTVAFFAVNVATGSLLSTDKAMPEVVTLVNRFFPYLTVVSTGTMLFLLW